MPVSESTIESAIENLKSSPGKFQRLVERYAQISYPLRFKNLVPWGRNTSDVTIKGWPDFFSISSNGLVEVAEATHSPEWLRHLDADVKKAEELGAGHYSGFLFVAWATEPKFSAEHNKADSPHAKLSSYRERLRALGIPSSNINFVFKRQLIQTLKQPRFANVLKDILELSWQSFPFTPIKLAHVFGSAKHLDVFAPAKDEFLGGLVHRTAIADEAKSKLENHNWVWIRGRGAAGKTVLAVQIALEYESNGRPAYYLDLARISTTSGEAIDIIISHADIGVLFVIDNVHLDEEATRDIFENWKSVSMGSRLLLLGRDVSYISARGTTSPLEELKKDAIILLASPDDLAGVFLRLARRFRASPDDLTVPPPKALQDWQALFGGDLIAFSAAVARRMKQLTQGIWQLHARDAADYVWETYLEKASEEERVHLLRMAVLAQLEVEVPVEAVKTGVIRPLLKGGLVHYATGDNDKGGYQSYHLVHAGLGDLLLTANGFTEEELANFISEQFQYVIQRKPACGPQIAMRLEIANRVEQAAAIWREAIVSNRGLTTALILPGFHDLVSRSRSLVRLKILSYSEIDTRLSSEPIAIGRAALHRPLFFLTSVLSYAQKNLPRVHGVLAQRLSEPDNLKALCEAAPLSSVGRLTPFLWYAERELPMVNAALADVLDRPENVEALYQTIFDTSLSGLLNFLRYADRNLPTTVATFIALLDRPETISVLRDTAPRTSWQGLTSFLQYAESRLTKLYLALIEVLNQPSSIQALVENIPNTALGGITVFMQYTEVHLPKVYISLEAALNEPESIEALSTSAVLTSLDSLVQFQLYAQQKLPTLHDKINEQLLKPELIVALATKACQSSVNALLIFLRSSTVASEVVSTIDLEEWRRVKLAKPEEPSGLVALSKEFQRLRRPELAETLAQAMIVAAEPTHWHDTGNGLPQISQVLRLGRDAGQDAILRFVSIIAPRWWVEQSLRQISTGALAASLFGLWGYNDESVLSHFCLDALEIRVKLDLTYLAYLLPQDVSAVLQLIGCAKLIGLEIHEAPVKRLSVYQIRKAIELTVPGTETETIGHVQIQFWLGLREVARMRPNVFVAQAEFGNQILTLWKNSSGYTKKHDLLKAWMVQWLERCAQRGWKLIADDTPMNEETAWPFSS